MNKRLVMLGLVAGCLTAAVAQADTSYPEHPITLIVTFAPGGNVDYTARLVAPAMSKALGQSVVVENRAGAGGIIGSEYVKRAPDDGYTVLVGSANISIAPFVYKHVPYQPLTDFVAVGGIQSVPLLLETSKKSGITNWAEFVRASKTPPGLTTATAGNGTSNDLALATLKVKSGLKLTPVPYTGSGPAISDLLAGHVPSMVDQLTSSLPQIRAGTLQPVAILTDKRSSQLPDVPTIKELGVSGVNATTWVGLFVRQGTPADVLTKLEHALQTALADPTVRQRLHDLGVTPFEMTHTQFVDFVKRDLSNNQHIVEQAHIQIQ